MTEQRRRKKPPGRSEMARAVHFRLAGPLGGSRKEQARRRRRKDRQEERQSERRPDESGEG